MASGHVHALAMPKDSPQLHFDADAHRYTVGERELPHVTGIINATCPRNYSCGDWYLTRGAAIHRCIHLLNQGKLDWNSVDERILPRIKAFQLFMQQTGCRVIISELPLHSPSMMYAGTVDALMVGLAKEPNKIILVDFKSSAEVQVTLQLGAYYRLCWESHTLDISIGLALVLNDDGSYRCLWMTKAELKRAQQTFFAALTLHSWLKKNKLTE